jgi:hypothetical protein
MLFGVSALGVFLKFINLATDVFQIGLESSSLIEERFLNSSLSDVKLSSMLLNESTNLVYIGVSRVHRLDNVIVILLNFILSLRVVV